MTLEEVVAKLFKMGEIVNLSMFKEDSIPTKNELLTKAGDILLPHEPITSVDLYCQANNTEKLNDFINNHLSKVEHSSSYEMLLEALIKACKFTNNKDSMYKVAKICLDKELAEKAITAFEFAGHPLPKLT